MGFHRGPKIITNGLVLALDAANPKSYPTTGTAWSDLSGNNNNGTLTNGPTFSSANGGSIVFDGTNDEVTLGSTIALNSASGTIGFWFKLTNTITTGYAGNQRPWGRNADFEARWGGNSNANDRKLVFDIGSTMSLLSTQDTWFNNIWYNAVLTWNSSVLQSNFYVQGSLDSTGTTANTSTLTQLTGTSYIGRSASGGFLNGNISNFSFYNRALSATEVLQNYNATKSRFNL